LGGIEPSAAPLGKHGPGVPQIVLLSAKADLRRASSRIIQPYENCGKERGLTQTMSPAVSDTNDPELETSPLSGEFSCDGITVSVKVYRLVVGTKARSSM